MKIQGKVGELTCLKFDINEKPKEVLTTKDFYKIEAHADFVIPDVHHNYVKFSKIILHSWDDTPSRIYKIKNIIFTQIEPQDIARIKIFDKHIISTVNSLTSVGTNCHLKNINKWHEVYVELDQ